MEYICEVFCFGNHMSSQKDFNQDLVKAIFRFCNNEARNSLGQEDNEEIKHVKVPEIFVRRFCKEVKFYKNSENKQTKKEFVQLEEDSPINNVELELVLEATVPTLVNSAILKPVHQDETENSLTIESESNTNLKLNYSGNNVWAFETEVDEKLLENQEAYEYYVKSIEQILEKTAHLNRTIYKTKTGNIVTTLSQHSDMTCVLFCYEKKLYLFEYGRWDIWRLPEKSLSKITQLPFLQIYDEVNTYEKYKTSNFNASHGMIVYDIAANLFDKIFGLRDKKYQVYNADTFYVVSKDVLQDDDVSKDVLQDDDFFMLAMMSKNERGHKLCSEDQEEQKMTVSRSGKPMTVSRSLEVEQTLISQLPATKERLHELKTNLHRGFYYYTYGDKVKKDMLKKLVNTDVTKLSAAKDLKMTVRHDLKFKNTEAGIHDLEVYIHDLKFESRKLQLAAQQYSYFSLFNFKVMGNERHQFQCKVTNMLYRLKKIDESEEFRKHFSKHFVYDESEEVTGEVKVVTAGAAAICFFFSEDEGNWAEIEEWDDANYTKYFDDMSQMHIFKNTKDQTKYQDIFRKLQFEILNKKGYSNFIQSKVKFSVGDGFEVHFFVYELEGVWKECRSFMLCTE